jgi:hypothetical protein
VTYPKESLAEAGTDYPIAFARHFARLIWLLLNDVTAYDAQLATLRALVNASREGAVTLAAKDWRLMVNGSALSDKFSGAQDLTAQLMGHSVAELTADQNASPADLLCLARILAAAPVPGDGGRGVQRKLEVLDTRRIGVRLEPAAVGASPTPPVESRSILHLPPRPAPEEDADDEDVELYDEQNADKMFQTFSAVETPKVSMQKHFELLDAAHTPTALARQLDTLVQLANESARKERVDLVAEVFHGLVLREAGTEDRAVKRSYGLAIRRLCTPGVLRAVISLLPRRRENYEQYMSIIARAEDAGAEALVEALVSAGSISDRRAYFDAMLNCRSGVRVLLFMLGDERWYVVRNACDLLGELRVTDADAQLTRLLDHEDERVRAAAAGALAKIGTGVAAKGLRVALRDASPEVRERAASALGSTRGARSAGSLIKAIDREEDIRVQMAMLTALGQIGTPDAVQKLVTIAKPDARLFKKNKASLRAAAVHALAEAKTPLAIATLQSLLRDKEKDVRGAAAWVLLGKKRESGAQPAVGEP